MNKNRYKIDAKPFQKSIKKEHRFLILFRRRKGRQKRPKNGRKRDKKATEKNDEKNVEKQRHTALKPDLARGTESAIWN